MLCAELIRAADRLHERALGAVQRVATMSVRAALDAEMARIERALLDPALTKLLATRNWNGVQEHMRLLLGDLAVIQQRAEAAASPSEAGPDAVHVPETREEALALLGLNATAEPRVAKKVVDAMRQCWHPDLARDERDRAEREARMKQINVAWELVEGRRLAA